RSAPSDVPKDVYVDAPSSPGGRGVVASSGRSRDGLEKRADDLDHEIVVIDLRQPRDGDDADHADVSHRERERSTVRGVLIEREPEALLERRAGVPRLLTD